MNVQLVGQTNRQREGGVFSGKVRNFGSVKTWDITEGTDHSRNIPVAIMCGKDATGYWSPVDQNVEDCLCGVRLLSN
jgi:hypothetical protein